MEIHNLVLSATIACVLYGIEYELELIDPVEGNAYDLDSSDANTELPDTLEKATKIFKNSNVMR